MKKKITLGVTGSIAAYKAAELASALTQAGHDVHAVLTRNAASFISPLTFATLTHNKAHTDMFADEDHTRVTHIDLGTTSDLILIAPATYNILGKAAHGIADDLLSSILAAAAPDKVLFAPAMNVNMYQNPACQASVAALLQRGCQFVEPEAGMLACGVMAKGRLAKVPAILEAVEAFFCPKTLAGKTILITAGATREYLDPIRFLSNSSSGRMGVALARACRNRGASVTLLLANSALDLDGVNLVRVDTVAEMADAVRRLFGACDWLIAAAAVSDFRPADRSPVKIKKNSAGLILNLEPTTDILQEISRLRTKQKLIGFAAESENLLENARLKLKKKNLDLVVANYLDNFASPTGRVWLVAPDQAVELPEQPKETLAEAIVDGIAGLVGAGAEPGL
ncbi:MAG TPA: bifunctional phosphopantothenoylcysteine decarboxylase/phosphopantothenate--cysteine ligase CoaBC [Clostridiales bacterium]|nr:bifunctional phosphopantothenoylcysteine decarboxylase/phosphopantothenate--cysteine ligase CoaBC [Clostridiales bacterium]